MDGGTVTKREHLKQIIKTYKQVGKDYEKQEEEITVEPYPPETGYLLTWYYELKRAGGITFTEIDSWARLYRRSVEPFEVEIIMQLDHIYETA